MALTLIGNEAFSFVDASRDVIVAAVFIFASIYLGAKLLPIVIARLARRLSDEVIFAVFLGLGLIFAFVATEMGLAAITGAFLMGAVIPYRKVGEKLVHRLFFMKEIFASVFFASIGLTINPIDVATFLPVALLVCGTGIGARLVGGYVGGAIAGMHGKDLTTSLTGLAIRAEISLIIAREVSTSAVVVDTFLPISATAVILSLLTMTPVYSRLVRKL